MHFCLERLYMSDIVVCLFHLFILPDARDREQLARNNITHILSIHDSAAPILKVRDLHLHPTPRVPLLQPV